MAEATALFGMPGSAVLAAARVAGEWGVLIETAQECQARRQGGGFRGINGGSVQRQKVYVQVTAWCLVAKAVRDERPRLRRKAPRKPAK